jgi:hypothetical protein
MRRLYRSSAILTIGVFLLIGWEPLAPARAETITPDSIASPPAAVSPLAQGTAVLPSQQVTEQYAGLGLLFGNAAIGEINGTRVWVPTLNFVDPKDPPKNNSLNFVIPSAILAGINVPGNVDAPAKTDLFRAEFVFDAGVSATPSMAAADLHFSTLTTNMQAVGTGPHGGMLEQLQAADMSIFALSGNTSETARWGIAEIELGSLTAVQTAPEPGTLVLAVIGSLSVIGYGRHRRRG